MKNFLLFFGLALAAGLTSCSSDDCAQEDWVGTFTGSTTCDGEDPEAGTFVITAVGDDQIQIADENGEDPFILTLDDCTATGTQDVGFGALTYTLTLDGDNMTITTSGNILGIPLSCSGSASRQ